jgi:hypothetical protein
MGATSIFYFRSCMNDGISQFIKLQSLQYRQSIAVAESSFLCRFLIESVNAFVLPRFDLCHVLSSSTNNFAHAQTLSRIDNNLNIRNHNNIKIIVPNVLKGIQAVRIEFFLY